MFHTKDLQVLWGDTNNNTLRNAISSLILRGILINIHRGFYSLVPLDQIDPVLLGFRSIGAFSYLSTESVLAKNGLINQSPSKITFVSTKSLSFSINSIDYVSRQLAPNLLNASLGVFQNNLGYFEADVNRAAADMLYFQKNYYFDRVSKIDWKKVNDCQIELGYL